jgi:hypothetical protein
MPVYSEPYPLQTVGGAVEINLLYQPQNGPKNFVAIVVHQRNNLVSVWNETLGHKSWVDFRSVRPVGSVTWSE